MIVDRETRHIYTDGRKFPPEDELWPTLLGRSIGHWEQTKEGQTLVVETISVRTGIWADLTPAMLSGQEKLLERIRQVDANTIEDQMTITDPVAAHQAVDDHQALHAHAGGDVGGRAEHMRRARRPQPRS